MRLYKVKYIWTYEEKYIGYGKDYLIDEKDFVYLWNQVPLNERMKVCNFLVKDVKYYTQSSGHFMGKEFVSDGIHTRNLEQLVLDWNQLPAKIRKIVINTNLDKIKPVW